MLLDYYQSKAWWNMAAVLWKLNIISHNECQSFMENLSNQDELYFIERSHATV